MSQVKLSTLVCTQDTTIDLSMVAWLLNPILAGETDANCVDCRGHRIIYHFIQQEPLLHTKSLCFD